MDDMNAFFENATPAQINEYYAKQGQVAQPEQPKQEEPQPEPTSVLEVLQQASPQTEAEPVVEAKPEPAVQVDPFQENAAQKNWRELREAKLRAEWEREEMARRLRSYEEAAKRPQAQEKQEEDWIKPDEIVEGKHVKQLIKQIREETRKEAQQQQAAMQAMMLETKLKLEMPDIDQVVSAENLRKLAQEMPEVAQALDESPNLYIKAKSAYTLIKKFNNTGLNSQPTAPIDDTKQRIANNLAKPKPVQSVARQSPLAGASAYDGPLSQGQKDKFYKEMMDAIRNG